jgi:multidrug efflux system membrane fusion protein
VAPADLPAVPVAKPAKRTITDYVDFTGRTDAIEAVDIRARVTGFLGETLFVEGSPVKKGDLLFVVDPRPYQAQHEQAQKQVDLNQASLKLARTIYERDRGIAATVAGGISRQQLDQDEAAVQEAVSRVRASEASREIYKLNVDFTKVVSPIDGVIGRYYLTKGNLVNQDQTLLTTVVSLDPMYVYFDMDEATLLRIRKSERFQDELAAAFLGLQVPRPSLLALAQLPFQGLPVTMGLSGEEGYPHEGRINFVNNQVNPATGSISMRGKFANPVLPSGKHLLSPGMFVRTRLPIGQPHPALLVLDRAIQADQGIKYVYVLDAENRVQSKRVTTGSLQEDGLRVVTSGLQPNDRVVIGALQQVRLKMQVQPDEQAAMPSLARPAGSDEGAEATPASGDSRRK